MIFKIFLLLMLLFLSGTIHGADDLKSVFGKSTLSGQFRSFYFSSDYDISLDTEDIAIGGMLYYRTAPLKGINIGLSFYTGQGKGLNNDDKGVDDLLARDENGDHDNYTALAEAYLQAEYKDTIIKIGRQELEMPFINGDDNCLTPQSFQGYLVINKSIPDLEISAGHITRMKGKTSSDFLSMTEFADITTANKPVTVVGGTYSGIDKFEFQLWDFYAHDFLNNIYFRADFQNQIGTGMELSVAFQYLDQTDTGDRAGGTIDTSAMAFSTGIEAGEFELTIAYAMVGDQDITYPWGHDFFVSALMNDASRADEDGIMLTAAYNFLKTGIPNLTAKIIHADFNTPDTGPNASYDYTETIFDIEYIFDNRFEGLSIMGCYGIVNQVEALGGEDYNDLRFYITYAF